MSAYKKLNKQDSSLTSYTAHKTFIYSGSEHDIAGIETYVGVSGSNTFSVDSSPLRLSGTNYAHYEDLVYRSIKHLYYSGFENAEPSTSSYDLTGSAVENYLQSSYTSQQRRAEDRFTVISIPRNLIGTHIKPGSVKLNTGVSGDIASYASASYTFEDYFEDEEEVYGGASGSVPTTTIDPQDFINGYRNLDKESYLSASLNIPSTWQDDIIDDGNGNLILSGSVVDGKIMERTVVGNVIYPHGLLILTNPYVANYYAYYFSGSLEWKASHPIYTYSYHCSIGESEFNFTQHPTAIKNGTTGSLADNITGSEFQPYFTTVGLYNDTNELIAVAKMAQPVPVSDNTEMTVVVKLDI